MFKNTAFGLGRLKALILVSLVGLGLFGATAHVQAESVTRSEVRQVAAADNRIESRTSTEEGSNNLSGQSIMTNTSTGRPQISENMQLLILFGLLIAMHGGATWVLKRNK